jgi:hypothetical protein
MVRHRRRGRAALPAPPVGVLARQSRWSAACRSPRRRFDAGRLNARTRTCAARSTVCSSRPTTTTAPAVQHRGVGGDEDAQRTRRRAKSVADAATGIAVLRECLSILIRVLYPVVPHVTHGLWSELGYAATQGDLLDAPWPQVDDAALVQDSSSWCCRSTARCAARSACRPAPIAPRSRRPPWPASLRAPVRRPCPEEGRGGARPAGQRGRLTPTAPLCAWRPPARAGVRCAGRPCPAGHAGRLRLQAARLGPIAVRDAVCRFPAQFADRRRLPPLVRVLSGTRWSIAPKTRRRVWMCCRKCAKKKSSASPAPAGRANTSCACASPSSCRRWPGRRADPPDRDAAAPGHHHHRHPAGRQGAGGSATLYREMQTDLVQQLLRRLAAVKR